MSNNSITIFPASGPLRGRILIPGDKSISHRAVMLGALSEGETRISGFLMGEDCLSTIRAFRDMGVRIEAGEEEVILQGAGLKGLKAPAGPIDCGNSGTTMRLLMGILAAQPFGVRLTGDASLCSRPMGRVAGPLSGMGAEIVSENPASGEKLLAPLSLAGHKGALKGLSYLSPVASAQVKSAILLAGLYADSPTTVLEPALSRDHTERMLKAFGAHVETGVDKDTGRPFARVYPLAIKNGALKGMRIRVPGDISSAACFLAAASLIPGSELLLENVGLNPTRDGFLRVLKAMGGNVSLENVREEGGEPCGDIRVRYSPLHGITIEGELIPAMIDELPMAAVLGAFAEGETLIKDAAELKVKESDRIAAMTESLSAMGAVIVSREDGWLIRGTGGAPLKGAVIDPKKDHRIAMSMAVAALYAAGETKIEDADCVSISFPEFYENLERIRES